MSLRLEPIDRAENFTQQVRETLVSAIASGSLERGGIYSMQVLADQLGVSRTPVREAMLQLQQRGLVKMLRNQGALILGPTLDDLRQIFQLRRWLEVPATREAVANAGEQDRAALWAHFREMEAAAARDDAAAVDREDRLLHSRLLALSGNDRVVTVLDDVRSFMIAHGHTTTGRSRSLREIVAQHEPILAAFDAGDADAAAAAMERHLEATETATLVQGAAAARR